MPTDLGKDAATLRLLLAPGLHSGAFEAGVAIVMAPGSHTYWKMPGEAGVPPVFSFNGSQNVAAAEVRFPTPRRITEEGIEAFGYAETVVFPVVVTPRDPAQPALLRADVTYAVCNKICLPAHGLAELSIPAAAEPGAAATIAKALAAVPVQATPDERGQLEITPVSGAAKPTWTLSWTGAPPIEDVFADAPEGYFFDTRKTGPGRWTLIADQLVTAPHATRVPVELTMSRSGGGLVVKEDLDVSSPSK